MKKRRKMSVGTFLPRALHILYIYQQLQNLDITVLISLIQENKNDYYFLKVNNNSWRAKFNGHFS